MKNKSMFFFCQLCGEATKITGYVISFLFFLIAEKNQVYKEFRITELLLLFKTLFPCALLMWKLVLFNHAVWLPVSPFQ